MLPFDNKSMPTLNPEFDRSGKKGRIVWESNVLTGLADNFRAVYDNT
jgi:hypothetical protein